MLDYLLSLASPFLIFQGCMGIKMVLESISGIIQKNKWLRNATISQAAITDRKEEFYDPGHDQDAHYIYELALRIEKPQMTSDSHEQLVWAGVSKRVFTRYANRNRTRIYYPLASPLEFLIEGE